MAKEEEDLSDIGLYGLAVMGQNLALNIASKGFKISVCNRGPERVDETIKRAKAEKCPTLRAYKDIKEFVNSISKPRSIIILVKAGSPVEDVIKHLIKLLDEGDIIIDGGNEWYENTENRSEFVKKEKNLLYMGMGVSGGEEGARHGPSLMPGGSFAAYKHVEKILKSIAAKSKDGTICCAYIGEGGAGNYVKMIHNGIEYGDMQLIAEAYDLLKNIGGLSNERLAKVFEEWNQTELESYLIEITSHIFQKLDDKIGNDNDNNNDNDNKKEEKKEYLVDKVLDKTGSKGTGAWTVQEAAEQGIAAPTISAALNVRYLSSLKEERVNANEIFKGPNLIKIKNEKELKEFINDVKEALYVSKIMSYTQGMNLIRVMGEKKKWNLNLGSIASIWKAGCIIRAKFLDRITNAYNNNKNLVSLIMDKDFSKEILIREDAWRRVIIKAINNGISIPALSCSLSYYDTYRRSNLPANLTQAQRDYFGAHTYLRIDNLANNEPTHSEWSNFK